MSIIKTHDITLYGSTGEYDIILRPLCDDHLPLLYKWNADPEVLYWTEGADVEEHKIETVQDIYGRSSQTAICFLIEVCETPVGECWLQKMNQKQIPELHMDDVDTRWISIMIGEKSYWNHGIGSAVVRMLIDFSFNNEYADLLQVLVFDYNERSFRLFERNGFQVALRVPSTESPTKAKEDIYLRLTRQAYIAQRRSRITSDNVFALPLSEIQPSQLYVSEGKLRLAREWFDPADKSVFDPIPVKLHKGNYLMIDGHTRAVLATLAGWDTVPVVWDDDPLDMLAYAEDVRWCHEAGIKSAVNLLERIVSHKEYEALWRKRCHYMEIPPSYAAITARFGCMDGRHRVITLTDKSMLETAKLIQSESADFVKTIDVINLDETNDYSAIHVLDPEDLLILHIGMKSWLGKHSALAHAFDKPTGVSAKYICIRPTITPNALFTKPRTPSTSVMG